LPRIKAKFLLKRWEAYGITKEEIVWVINEGKFTIYDRNADLYEGIDERYLEYLCRQAALMGVDLAKIRETFERGKLVFIKK